ncbi:MAG: PAS domain-containing protein [Collinsella sp.]
MLHDFSDPDHAIVDIRNGIVSGRKVGGPATDLALKIMHDAKYRDLPFITGYEGAVPVARRWSRRRTLSARMTRSVGMLCVNTDLRPCATSVPWPSSLWPALTPLPHAPSPPPSRSKAFRSPRRSSSTAVFPSC